MPYFPEQSANNREFNNADSFCIAFDSAWKELNQDESSKKQEQDKKIELALKQIESHPFVIDSPSKARDIAKFRIRLLKLG